MLEILINNQSYSFPNKIDLEEMLKELNISTQGIAIAVNESVIPKSEWQHHRLNHQDTVILIQATQGG